MSRPGRAGPAAALVILILGLVPWADLLAGGWHLQRAGETYDGWWSGTLVAAGVGVVYALTTRPWPTLWREGAWARLVRRLDLLAPARAALLALVAFGVYALVAAVVFERHPILIDEIVQIWQARVYASGHLSAAATGAPEFFGTVLIVDDGIKSYSQFPAGGPAMFALGALVRLEWLVGPLFGAVAVWAFAGMLRALREPEGIATAALLLAAFSPFVLFMSGSHMNHTLTLAWLCVGLWGVALLATAEAPRAGAAILAGIGFGLAATIRPVDGFAFALPVGLWLLYRTARERRWALPMLSYGCAAALPVAALLWVNARTTGHPFLFGYRLLWGAAHDLGFHQAPWGPAHTPRLGLELVNIYLFQLHTYFLESPFPALLPAAIALALTPRLAPFDRLLLAGSTLLLGFYFAYWHAGFFPGPRFVYPLVPFLALWTARAYGAIRRTFGEGLPYRSLVGAGVASLGIVALVSLPLRWREYARFAPTLRWPADVEADRAGVRHALVLVRESWGAQLVVRLWALGLTRADTEFLYHRVDACRLDAAVDELERDTVRGAGAFARLRPLTADSARLLPSPFSPDRSERFLPGGAYAAT
ncbi:MAG: hypothetical protein ABJB33_05555, partial [Gemmatimonadota bacterium]